jgi:hypothetical protein
MPLTAKGEKIESAMKKEYGAKKGESVFYASKNAGTIGGVDFLPTTGIFTSEPMVNFSPSQDRPPRAFDNPFPFLNKY